MQLFSLHEPEEERGGREGEETGSRKRREEGRRVERNERRGDIEEGGDRRQKRSVEVEERRMQLWDVTGSRPVVGAGLQAPASPPGEAAETRQLRLGEKQSARSAGSAGPLVFLTQAEHSRAARMHAANTVSGNLNDGFKSFSVSDHLYSKHT